MGCEVKVVVGYERIGGVRGRRVGVDGSGGGGMGDDGGGGGVGEGEY